ncbi:MAG: AMP-binding protein [Victivallales bacterium]|nr:AMP-binding protein [Victivallales bacterium]
MKWLSFHDKIALQCGQRKIGYTQLFKNIANAANVLKQHCQAGDRVAILGENSPEWVTAMYGAWQMHAMVVTIDFMSAPEDIAYILDDCTPKVVWTDEKSMEKLNAALAMLKTQEKPVILRLEDLRQDAQEEVDRDKIGESDDHEIAFIIYTSGTTGYPKGVMLSFENLEANILACTTQREVFIREDRVLVVLPLHHAYPLMATVVMPMSIGASAVFAEGLNGEAILKALNEGKCTFIVGVPRLLEIFRNSMMQKVRQSFIARLLYRVCVFFDSLWLSRKIFKKVQDAFGGHIRYISSGGAAADPQVTRDFYALGFQLLEGYGMTETSPMISFTPPDGIHKPGSPGKPIPCNEIKIKDGEVLVKGKNVMVGYYKRPEETAKIIDAEGWLHTGDLGYVDEDGFLFLTGRSKELIILGNGKNIIPYELEHRLQEKAGTLLSEIAVTDDGSNLVAVAVPDMEVISAKGIVNIRQTILDQVIEPFNEAEPSYKRIANLVIQETPLPRTRLGKLRRHVIRENLNAKPGEHKQEQTSAPAPDTDSYKHLIASIEKVSGRKVGPDEHLELDVGLDSLAKLNLLSSLNSDWGIWLEVEALAKYPTARALAAEIDARSGKTESGQVEAYPLPHAGITHGFLRFMVAMYLRCISHYKVQGLENIPDGPCIFAPNHQSYLDGPALCIGLNSAKFKSTLFYVYSKYIEGFFSKGFARRHNAVPMEINGDIRKSIATLHNGLKDGKSILIFPEGTRSMDGSLGEFKATFAQLAFDAKVPVVPVAIDGTFKALPRHKRFPKWGQDITVTFLPPINPQPGKTPADICFETKDAIATALNAEAQ